MANFCLRTGFPNCYFFLVTFVAVIPVAKLHDMM